jgi:hypothetical protein
LTVAENKKKKVCSGNNLQKTKKKTCSRNLQKTETLLWSFFAEKKQS